MDLIPVLVTLEDTADAAAVRGLLEKEGLQRATSITDRILSGTVAANQLETLRQVVGVRAVEKERQNRTLPRDPLKRR